MTTRKAESATPVQRHQISLLLMQHCSTNEEGLAVYADGWNDQKVATEVGMKSDKSAAYVRSNNYGLLNVRAVGVSKLDLLARINVLETSMVRLVLILTEQGIVNDGLGTELGETVSAGDQET